MTENIFTTSRERIKATIETVTNLNGQINELNTQLSGLSSKADGLKTGAEDLIGKLGDVSKALDDLDMLERDPLKLMKLKMQGGV